MTALRLLLLYTAVTPSADEVVTRVVAERLKINAWHVTGSYRCVDRQYEKENTAYRFELWRDGDRARTDRRPLEPEANPGRTHFDREVTCVGCWPTDRRVVWGTFPQTPLEHQPPDRPLGRRDAEMVGLDIRKFGLIPDSIFGHPMRPIDTVWKGIPLAVADDAGGKLVLSGTHPEHGYTLRLTVDPAQGHCVTAIDTDGVTPKSDPPSRWRNQTRITPAREPVTGLWYVRESVYKSWQDDKPVRDLTVTLDTVELNQPSPPRAFSLAGLDLPIGWMVSSAYEKGTKGTRYWDGTKVVDTPPANREVVYTPPPAPPEPVTPPARWPGWLAPALAVGFATAAVLLLRRAVRRRTG